MKLYFIKQDKVQTLVPWDLPYEEIQLPVTVPDNNAVFVTMDTPWGRSIMAKIAARRQLPISLSRAIPKKPSCVLLPHTLPYISKAAKVWFIGGRGLGSMTEYNILADMAKRCYAEIGATRAIVDAGWAPQSRQIGQGGLKIMADFVVTVGVSGAIQHLEGLKDVKNVIAINPNPQAVIFQRADYGILANWQAIKKDLLKLLFYEIGD